jgi:hypothetical protein
MPPRNSHSGRTALRLVLLVLAGLSLFTLRGRRHVQLHEAAQASPTPEPTHARAPLPAPPRAKRWSPRRVAASFVVAICFFAGAALSAGAGDKAALTLEDGIEPVQVQTEPTPAAEPVTVEPETPLPAEPADPVEATADEPLAVPHGTDEPQPVPVEPAPAPAPAPELASARRPPVQPATTKTVAPGRITKPAKRRQAPRAAVVHAVPAPGPTVLIPMASTAMWLGQAEPVATPPALRLSRSFADRLAVTARRTRADWTVLFGILRARGADGPTPASPTKLRALAASAAGVRAETNSLSSTLLVGDEELAERAAALARYAKAVGLDTLVDGLEESGSSLGERVLADERITIYPSGRADIALGRIDVRVLALVEYLAETYGQVTVSSLESGHRLFSRPGVLSAHVFGRAVDIAALGGIPILGNQEAGGITEHAVRNILRLPAELQPRQVISLFGLGGPSFPLPDHDDHIHVGY